MFKRACTLVALSIFSAAATQAASLTLAPVVSIESMPASIKTDAPAGDTDRLFILDRREGVIKVQNKATGEIAATPYLILPDNFQFDLNNYPASNAYSFAFDPDYSTNGKVYVSYVDTNQDLRVLQATVSATNPDRVDTASYKYVMTIPYEAPFVPEFGVNDAHYGGDLTFVGKDLYVTTGDDWWSPTTPVFSQSKDSLHGKVLRIDPNGVDAFPGDDGNNFAIPGGNPFVSGGPDPKLTDAIWALGFRNPYRASYDPVTGAFFIGDVGQDLFEEINLLQKGGNYGWPIKEGTAPFDGAIVPGEIYLDPLHQYPHSGLPIDVYAVIAGQTYRGPLAQINGKFFFADFVNTKIWSFVFDPLTSSISELLAYDLIVANAKGYLTNIISFGTDGEGNMYVISDVDGVLKVVGAEVDVPLPAAALLMLSGLGVLGWRARRAN